MSDFEGKFSYKWTLHKKKKEKPVSNFSKYRNGWCKKIIKLMEFYSSSSLHSVMLLISHTNTHRPKKKAACSFLLTNSNTTLRKFLTLMLLDGSICTHFSHSEYNENEVPI